MEQWTPLWAAIKRGLHTRLLVLPVFDRERLRMRAVAGRENEYAVFNLLFAGGGEGGGGGLLVNKKKRWKKREFASHASQTLTVWTNNNGWRELVRKVAVNAIGRFYTFLHVSEFFPLLLFLPSFLLSLSFHFVASNSPPLSPRRSIKNIVKFFIFN